jgi:thioredoxin 1
MSEPVHIGSAEAFEKHVIQSEKPAVVDFWAEWCKPCHMVAPSVAKLAEKYDGKAGIFKVDVDDLPEIAQRFGVRGIPTLVYFKGGEEVERLVGARPYEQLEEALKPHVG